LPDRWEDDYCLVNPTVDFAEEDEAWAAASEDLDEAFLLKKQQGGNPFVVAECLSSKGCKTVDGFQRAVD